MTNFNGVSQSLRDQAARRQQAQQYHDYWGTEPAKEKLQTMVGRELTEETAQQIGQHFDSLHSRTSTVLRHDVDLLNWQAERAAAAEREAQKQAVMDTIDKERAAKMTAYHQECQHRRGQLEGYRKAWQEYSKALYFIAQGKEDYERDLAAAEAQNWLPQTRQILLTSQKVGEQGRDSGGRFTNKQTVSTTKYVAAKKQAQQNFDREWLARNPNVRDAMNTVKKYEERYQGENVFKALKRDIERVAKVSSAVAKGGAGAITSAPGLMDRAWDSFWAGVADEFAWVGPVWNVVTAPIRWLSS